MDINDLEQILKEIPILIVPKIRLRIQGKFYSALGLAVNKAKPDGTAIIYTVVPYECDDMARSLLYGSIQHYYNGLDKSHTMFAENLFWERPIYRKACQKKIVELLGERDL